MKKLKEESDNSDKEVSKKEKIDLFVRHYNIYLKRNKVKHTDKGIMNFKNTHPNIIQNHHYLLFLIFQLII